MKENTNTAVDRLPPLPREAWTDAQRRAAEAITRGPRGGVYGPFVPLLRSPELTDCAHRMGEYLRYRSAIGTRLSELVILVVARYWDQQVEWAIHAPIALRAGIDRSIVDAIAHGRRPATMSEDEALVHDFSMELNLHRAVKDETFERARVRFGEHGVVDLLGLNGYYTFLAMIVNGARTPAPASAAPPLPVRARSIARPLAAPSRVLVSAGFPRCRA
ncbi:MAG TPA: carboxymuconolactone decarboxylase family protein [Casimicrobiaceae bacterium]|nr:carboxymuconolactone decarboxylase family protein [Casimicrobiaceae bacterium]